MESLKKQEIWTLLSIVNIIWSVYPYFNNNLKCWNFVEYGYISAV